MRRRNYTKIFRNFLLLMLLVPLMLVVWRLFIYQSPSYIPSNIVIRHISTIEDGYLLAEQVAENWQGGSYVSEVFSVYTIIGREHMLAHYGYTFVSPDKNNAITVSVDGSGQLKHLPPINIKEPPAYVSSEGYFFEHNVLSEAQVVKKAWQELGENLDNECGPVERATVYSEWGIAKPGERFQYWSVVYWGDEWKLGSVAYNAETGKKIGETRPNLNRCNLPRRQ